MTPELKAKWIEKLTDGSYTQGRTYLRAEDNTYCCLGVLHEAAGGKWSPDPKGGGFCLNGTNRRCTLTTPFEMEPVHGLNWYIQGKLVCLNDGDGAEPPQSFAQIAKWIEENI